jgi:FixJ family two-component response regulator
MQNSRDSRAVIAIVDDDPSVREGLESLIRSAGWRAETFGSAQEFLARAGSEAPSCLILDLQLPGLSGLDLQKRMAEVALEIPIVFLTGHGDIPASVKAMKAGAIEFLTKPVAEEDLRGRSKRQSNGMAAPGSSMRRSMTCKIDMRR